MLVESCSHVVNSCFIWSLRPESLLEFKLINSSTISHPYFLPLFPNTSSGRIKGRPPPARGHLAFWKWLAPPETWGPSPGFHSSRRQCCVTDWSSRTSGKASMKERVIRLFNPFFVKGKATSGQQVIQNMKLSYFSYSVFYNACRVGTSV